MEKPRTLAGGGTRFALTVTGSEMCNRSERTKTIKGELSPWAFGTQRPRSRILRVLSTMPSFGAIKMVMARCPGVARSVAKKALEDNNDERKNALDRMRENAKSLQNHGHGQLTV